jgi:peptidoglycan/LPS O-acetylase OafA/YrhL
VAGIEVLMRVPRLRCESDELLHLDVMRFVAAIAVVVYHFRNQWTFGPVRGDRISAFDNMSLAVDLFFVISGIVITYAYHDMSHFGRFMQKRFARLAPLHYATLLFYLVIGFAAPRLGSDMGEPWRYRPDCLLPNLLFLQAFGTCSSYSFNHVSWSISAEMLAYLLFPLFLILLNRHRALPLALALIMLALLYGAGPIGPEPRMWHQLTYDYGFVRVLPAFLMGMSLWGCRDLLRRLPMPGAVLGVLCVLFIGGLVAQAPRGLLVPVVYAMAAVALACDVQGGAGRLTRRIAPLGALTYGIYMLHPMVRTLIYPTMRSLHVPNNLVVAIMFLLVPVAAYLSLFLFEAPARRAISGLRFANLGYSAR